MDFAGEQMIFQRDSASLYFSPLLQVFFSPHCFFILAIPIGVTWYLIVILMFIYLIVILMFIFLIATNVEHLFTCLLVTHISSLVKCLFMSFSHFLTGFFLKFSF